MFLACTEASKCGYLFYFILKDVYIFLDAFFGIKKAASFQKRLAL
jgi:hypothetical protein